MSSYFDHVVICGYDAGTQMLLDAITEEVDLSQRGTEPGEVVANEAKVRDRILLEGVESE